MRQDNDAAVILFVAFLFAAPLAIHAWLRESPQDRAIVALIQRQGSPDRITDQAADKSRRVEYSAPGGSRRVFIVSSDGRVAELAR